MNEETVSIMIKELITRNYVSYSSKLCTQIESVRAIHVRDVSSTNQSI